MRIHGRLGAGALSAEALRAREYCGTAVEVGKDGLEGREPRDAAEEGRSCRTGRTELAEVSRGRAHARTASAQRARSWLGQVRSFLGQR